MKRRIVATLKNNGRIFLILLLLILLGIFTFYRMRQTAATPCPSPTADPDGYLANICQYVRDNNLDVSPGNPARYQIVRTEMSERNGRSVILIFLNCCYLGDVAIVDAATGEVIDLQLGDK
jgi:hypothetical protein